MSEQARREKRRDEGRRYREAYPDRIREASRRYREAHPERVKERSRNYYRELSEEKRQKLNARQKARRAADPEKARAKDRAFAKKNPEWIRNKNLKMKYGITLVQWRELFDAQNRVCKLCLSDKPGNKDWATDHDHDTGRVRGILCHRCNLALGWLGDTASKIAERYKDIVAYLAEPLRIEK
jgi:hypothetical protein